MSSDKGGDAPPSYYDSSPIYASDANSNWSSGATAPSQTGDLSSSQMSTAQPFLTPGQYPSTYASNTVFPPQTPYSDNPPYSATPVQPYPSAVRPNPSAAPPAPYTGVPNPYPSSSIPPAPYTSATPQPPPAQAPSSAYPGAAARNASKPFPNSYQQAYQPQSPPPGTSSVAQYELARARAIMNSGLCDCFSDISVCCGTLCFPSCVFGYNYSRSQQGSCLVGCCCYPLLCGCSRSKIQEHVGSDQQPCLWNCILHSLMPCCALSQETRALSAYITAYNVISPYSYGGVSSLRM